jgi:hypothetical protein
MSSTAAAASPLSSVLKFDAVTGVGSSLALVLAHVPLAPLLGLPAWLLLAGGLLALPSTLVMWTAARDPLRHAGLVWAVILGNAAWVVVSLLVAFVWFTPTAFGTGLVVAQALGVLVLACLQYRAFARLRAPASSR